MHKIWWFVLPFIFINAVQCTVCTIVHNYNIREIYGNSFFKFSLVSIYMFKVHLKKVLFDLKCLDLLQWAVYSRNYGCGRERESQGGEKN